MSPQTRWGSFELVLAAKLLLREALLEPTNAFFVMVSESDVPLYPPSVVYRQITAEGRSRIDACGIEVCVVEVVVWCVCVCGG